MTQKQMLSVGLMLALCAFPALAQERLNPTEQWTGKHGNLDGLDLIPASGAITDAETWEKLWTVIRPNERLPEVDFTQELILIGTAQGPNRVALTATRDDQGNVDLLAISTKVAGPGYGYSMIKVSCEGIRSVQGEALSDVADEDTYVKVEVKGTLTTGILAIGGETTGISIRSGAIIWEVDFGDNRRLRQRAERFNGQTVIVEGELERKDGVEVRERWIVHATALRVPEDD